MFDLGEAENLRREERENVLEDEISYLVEKLNELKSPKVKDMEARKCRHNFEGVSEEVCVKGIQKMAEATFLVHSDHSLLRNNNGKIDTLSSKMEALSKGVLTLYFQEEPLPSNQLEG